MVGSQTEPFSLPTKRIALEAALVKGQSHGTAGREALGIAMQQTARLGRVEADFVARSMVRA